MSKRKDEIKAVMAPASGINQKDPLNLIKDTAWADGNNVRFGPGFVEKAGGGFDRFVCVQRYYDY